jgi:hypothetical protein
MEEAEGKAPEFDTETLVKELLACMHAIGQMATTRPEHKAGASSRSTVSSRNLP